MTDSQQSDDGDDVSRRWLIRILIGLGIGIPVIVEGATFLSLFSSALFGEDGDDGDTDTPTPTDSEPLVRVGDELLADTPPSETVREAYLDVEGNSRQFVLTVAVDNTGDTPYALQLGDVTTATGQTVTGGTTTGRLEPGESTTVTHTWSLPANDRPETLAVVGLSYTDGNVEVTEREVRLAQVPLRG